MSVELSFLLGVGITAIFCEIRLHLRESRWQALLEKYADRIGAQTPGVLEELTARDHAKIELEERERLREPEVTERREAWMPPEPVAVGEELESLRDEADAGAATFL